MPLLITRESTGGNRIGLAQAGFGEAFGWSDSDCDANASGRSVDPCSITQSIHLSSRNWFQIRIICISSSSSVRLQARRWVPKVKTGNLNEDQGSKQLRQIDQTRTIHLPLSIKLSTTMGVTQHHFVLVHGGGHGAWCWMRVVPRLEKAGHRVTTVDLYGAGNHPGTADDCTSFEQYNQPLMDVFSSFPDDEKVVLVGHSLGGMSLTHMQKHFPKNISVAIYLSAFLPSPDGDYAYLYNMIAKDPTLFQQLDWQKCYKVEGGPSTSKAFSPKDLKQYFYNGCNPEDIDIALKHVRTLPNIGVLYMSTKATKENYWSVPKVFILALDDKIISPTIAHKMIKQNPPNEVIEINSSHSMFFHSVDTTIKVLLDVATKYDT